MKRVLRMLTLLTLFTMLMTMLPLSFAGAAPEPEEKNKLQVTAPLCRVRTSYASGSPILSQLKKGTTLYFVSSYLKGTYYRVQTLSGLSGYVWFEDVKFVYPEYHKDQLAQLSEIPVVTVTADYVNMRAGIAGTAEHKLIVNYHEGLMKKEKLYCIAVKNNWYKVVRQKESPDGTHLVGWVYGDFLNNPSGAKWDKFIGGIPADEETKRDLQLEAEALKVIKAINNMK